MTRLEIRTLVASAPAEKIAAFWATVDQRGEDECWPWKGGRTGDGYGVFKIGRWRGPHPRKGSVATPGHCLSGKASG